MGGFPETRIDLKCHLSVSFQLEPSFLNLLCFWRFEVIYKFLVDQVFVFDRI